MAVPLKKKKTVLHPTHKCASAQKNKKLSAGPHFSCSPYLLPPAEPTELPEGGTE